ncbi:MAG: thioesterase family protein [Syntrophales bacterium]|nr:thioesterase family protein [Syntrophales bacterium]
MSKKNLTKIRVIYADTDALGIVYHTNYIKWFEIGRGELLRELGIPYSQIENMGYYLPLTEVNCHYLCPARYDQIVLIETQIIFVKRASIKFRFLIWDEKQEKTLVEGESVHACINKQGKLVRIPREITEKIDPER